MFLLAATVLAVAGEPGATIQSSNKHTLIVRFDRGVTKEQAVKMIEKAGAKVAEVISAERATYLAAAKDDKTMQAAVNALGKSKKVMYAESEKTYRTNQSKRQPHPSASQANKRFRIVPDVDAANEPKPTAD